MTIIRFKLTENIAVKKGEQTSKIKSWRNFISLLTSAYSKDFNFSFQDGVLDEVRNVVLDAFMNEKLFFNKLEMLLFVPIWLLCILNFFFL